MQRLGLTTDHRDQTDDLACAWRNATRDGVIDPTEIARIDAGIRAVVQGAAEVDDTVRYVTTVLKIGTDAPSAVRQRRHLTRLHGTPEHHAPVALPVHVKTRRSDRPTDPSAA